jgi:O-antigen/teichoic acid export membrane protein
VQKESNELPIPISSKIFDVNEETMLEEELSSQEIKKRSVSGVVALVSRTFVIQIISFVSTLALTIFLDPNTYGVFYLVSSVVNFLGYFSDVGLAAALIQKKEKITKEDLATTFSIQQLLVISLLLLLFILSPFIKSQYHISQDGIYLLYAMAISFFLSSLKTIPSILLERDIKFNKLIIPQILETLVFNGVAVFAAWKGLGVTAFSLAVLSRGIVGLVAMYIVSPWKPVLGIYKNSLNSLLKFGLPYQANTFLAVLKDDGMTIVLTSIIGTQGLGYIGWASRWAALPLRILMDNLTKVSFPAFSRLQHDKERLIQAVEINIKYLCLAAFPVLIGLGFMADPVIHLIPRYTKWLPALIPLYIYLYSSAWAGISTSLTNLMNAVGHIKVTFKLMIMWTVLTWATMPILSIKFGYLGVAYATLVIATSSAVTVIMAKKYVDFSLIRSLKSSVVSSGVLALFLLLVKSQITSILNIIVISILSVVIYSTFVIIFEGKHFVAETLSIFKSRNA